MSAAHILRIRQIAAACLAMALAACAGMTSALDNSDWQLEGWAGHQITGDGLEPVDLHIEQRQVWGFAGCNQFSAGYVMANGVLKTHDLRVTRNACTNPAQQQLEQTLLGALEHGVQLVRDGSHLSLQTASAPLEFSQQLRFQHLRDPKLVKDL